MGPETVNTVPMDTLNAFRDHGQAFLSLTSHDEEAMQVLQLVQQAGIDLNEVAQQLEDEGIQKFNAPYAKLLLAIDQQRNALVSSSDKL
ncbi:hypothetical protein GCM10028808_71290 [Spirosoma migulaei]